MVNRTLPYVSLDNNKALPELTSRSISSSKSRSQRSKKKNSSSAGNTKFTVPSIGSKLESTNLYNVKPNQGLIDNLYQSLLKAGAVLSERELISPPRSPKVRIETEHSNDYGISSPRTESLELGVKALNSFVIAAGNIHHGNRLIKYIIREILGTCFSIDLLVPATEQTWTVFVPTTDPIKELMKTWKRRMGTKFEEANHIDKLCTWLLSCLQLHFNSRNMIVSAEFNQELFKNLYQLEIRANVNMSVVLIQSHVRRYLSNKHLRESLLRIQKVNDGRALAMMRARNRKLLKSYDSALNRTSNSTNQYTQALNEKGEDQRKGSERSNRKTQNQNNYLYGIVSEAENQVASPYHAHPPNYRGGSDRKVRPNFNNSVNSQDDNVENDNRSIVESTEKPTQGETYIDGQQYVSYFESNPTRANMITKQTLWTNTVTKTGRSNIVYSTATENEGSLSNLIRVHNDNALNKRPFRSRNAKTVALQLMRQEVSLLLSKVELLEQKLNEEREINARNEYYLKEEFSQAKNRAAKVAEQVALKARQDVIEEVSQKMMELQNDVVKTERERDALILRELESIKKKWSRRSKTPGATEKKLEEAVNNPPDEKELEKDSWIDVSLDERKDDDELSETSLERRLRLNAATRKVRKETSKRSRKRTAANEGSDSIELSWESLSATNGEQEQVEAEEDAQSETSLERRLRLNAETRKAKKKKSRRSKKHGASKEASDSTEPSEDFSTVDRGGEQEEDDEAALSETSLERRLRLNSDSKKEKKGRRARKRREDDATEQMDTNLILSTATELGEGDNIDAVEDSRSGKRSERREKDRKSRHRKGRGRNRRIRLNTPELRAKTKSISPIKEVDTDEAPFSEESYNVGLSVDQEVPGQVLTEFSLLTIVSQPSVVEDDQFDVEKIGLPNFAAKKTAAVSTTPVASDKAVTFSSAEDNLSPTPSSVVFTPTKPITLPAVNASSIAISPSNSLEEKSGSTKLVAEDATSAPAVKPVPVSLPRNIGRSVSTGVAMFHQNPKSSPASESSTSETVAHSVSMKATLATTPTTSLAKTILPQSPAPSPKNSLQPKPSEKPNYSSIFISAVAKVISRNNSVSSSKQDDEKSNENRSRSSSVDTTKAKDAPVTTAPVESDVKEKSGALRAIEFFKKGQTNSAVKRPGTGSRPGSNNRILRPSTTESGSDLIQKNVSASKIQRVIRNYARRRKFAKSKNDYSVLRADGLLRIIDSTRDEAILSKAFKTSIELAYLLLAKKSVSRSLELYGKYLKSGILYPLNVDLLIECMQFFNKDSKDLVDKGFDALSVVVKLKPNYLSETNPDLCNLIIHTVSNYLNETLLVFKATKCLYRMCDKNESNRLTFGQLEGCLAMKKLLEVHLKNSSLIENLSKCVINMCISCPENQALLGEIGVCDIVFEAFVEYMTVERLFYLLGRTIINLCAGNLRSNQDRMAKGQYPNVFLKAIATYKTFPKAIEQIITCILSIVANNKVNKTRFQDAGLCEMLMDDVMAQATDATILSNCFWALSTILTSSGAEEKHKEQHDRATAMLREFENGKNPNEEVARQAKIALHRMTRSSSTTGTPVTYVPIKRSNTAAAGAMVKL